VIFLAPAVPFRATAMSLVIELAGVGALKVPPLCLGASGLGNMGGAISDGTALDTVHAMIDDALSVSPCICMQDSNP
jgi:hypothetical protein